jgi:hypothetical protein
MKILVNFPGGLNENAYLVKHKLFQTTETALTILSSGGGGGGGGWRGHVFFWALISGVAKAGGDTGRIK